MLSGELAAGDTLYNHIVRFIHSVLLFLSLMMGQISCCCYSLVLICGLTISHGIQWAVLLQPKGWRTRRFCGPLVRALLVFWQYFQSSLYGAGLLPGTRVN